MCPGRGNRRLFESLGATRVIEGGQTMNPSAADILEAIEAVPTEDVLVLPNNSNVILTAEQAAALEREARTGDPLEVRTGGVRGHRSVCRDRSDGGERARDARGARRRGDGRDHRRLADATLDGVEIREGAYLGLVDDVAVVSGPELDAVLHDVVDRVLAGGQSFLTILTGEDAPALDGLVAALEARHPDLEVEIHEGGQPHYPLLLVAQ